MPVLTRARVGPLPSSKAIDAGVRDILADALAIYEVDLDRLKEARPDVIVTQDLCDVCAVSLDDVRAAVARLARSVRSAIVRDRPRSPSRWRAVAAGKVFVADGNAFINRPGPRIVESLEIMAACVYPEAFRDFAHAHKGSYVRADRDLVIQW